MAKKGPGKAHREGMSLMEAADRFRDDEVARKWFEEQRWPDGKAACPHCGSTHVQSGTTHPTMTHRCRDCKKFFSVKTGTVMHGSKLSYSVWAMAIYLITTNIKGISSMKLHRDLKVTQKSAWHLAHRLRQGWQATGAAQFKGPVEVDETYIGGKERNKHISKRKALGRGGVGKAIVIGAKDRATNQISAAKIENTDRATLHDFVNSRAVMGSMVYTDDHAGYSKVRNRHQTVKHSVSQYINGQAHTNGIESFWALLKRGYHGTYHHMSEKHLDRYVGEFSGRYNDREADTIDQMGAIVKGMDCKRLRYKDLVA